MEARKKLNATLKAWFTTFVREYRRQYEALPDDSKKRLSYLSDFRPPCKILVFWAAEPDYQDILVIREPGVSEDTIKIYGPAPPELMISEAEAMLNDRWFVSPPEPVRSTLEHEYKTMVQNQLLGILRNLPQARLRLPPRTDGGFAIIKRGPDTQEYFTWAIFGNLLALDPIAFAAETLSDSVKPGTVGQPSDSSVRAEPQVPQASEIPRPTRPGFISAFYPPIWLREPHTFTFREKLDGFLTPPSSKQLKLTYKGKELTVMLNGLLTLIEPDKETCLKLLNEIMCTSLLLGVPSTIVRDDDIVDALFYDNGNWGQYSMDISEHRSASLAKEYSPITEDEFGRFKVLSDDDLRIIVAKAQEATGEPDQSSFARWYVDAHTYLEDGDYGQSILKSWLIIEHNIILMWRALAGSDTGHGRRDPHDKKKALEDLYAAGKLTKDEFLNLDGMRVKRNNVVHHDAKAMHPDAESFLATAEGLTRTKLGILKPLF